MECLYWLKISVDGKRSLLLRAKGDLRTVTHSNLLAILSQQLRDYSPVVDLGIPLMTATLYIWSEE